MAYVLRCIAIIGLSLFTSYTFSWCTFSCTFWWWCGIGSAEVSPERNVQVSRREWQVAWEEALDAQCTCTPSSCRLCLGMGSIVEILCLYLRRYEWSAGSFCQCYKACTFADFEEIFNFSIVPVLCSQSTISFSVKHLVTPMLRGHKVRVNSTTVLLCWTIILLEKSINRNEERNIPKG